MLREATTPGDANAGAVRGSSGGHGRDRQRSDADAGQRPERWLVPVLSPEAIRLVAALGGTLGPELTAATPPRQGRRRPPGAHQPQHPCTAAPRSASTRPGSSSQELARAGAAGASGVPRDKRARWGRLLDRRGRLFIRPSRQVRRARQLAPAASSRCGSTCSPRASSPSADSAPPRWRSATPSRAP